MIGAVVVVFTIISLQIWTEAQLARAKATTIWLICWLTFITHSIASPVG